MSKLAATWRLLQDFRGCLRDEAHQCRPETYHLVRQAYITTRGASRRVLRWVYGRVRPVRASGFLVDAPVLEAIRRDGLAVVPGFLTAAQCGALHAYFREIAGFPVSKNFARGHPAIVTDADGTPRLSFDTHAVLRAPGIGDILGDRRIQHLAAAYLGCEPIFTTVSAWWSLADPGADDEALSRAAQLYHFDHDWPAFVKFFFYLTDVTLDDGPFTFVQGTHDAKREWKDGRVSDAYIDATYGGKVRAITGSAGDMIVADTVGYHKGARVKTGPRLILQFEFSVARFGAGFQYERYPRSLRPRSDFRHTFDVFCEPR